MSEQEKRQLGEGFTTAEMLMYATVRIECADPVGRTSSGTGFFYQIPLGDGLQPLAVIVTNRHVLEGAATIGFHLHCASEIRYARLPLVTEYVGIEFPAKSAWLGHPDPSTDLAVIPLDVPQAMFVKETAKYPFGIHLNRNTIPNEHEFLDFGPLTNVVMVGYPNGLWDSSNNFPIFRRGVTATHCGIKYMGRDEFLVDIACFPGSSGSPILSVSDHDYRIRHDEPLQVTPRLKLLGILYAGPVMDVSGDIVVEEIPTAKTVKAVTATMINLGYAVSSTKLADFTRKYLETQWKFTDLRKDNGV